MSFELKIPLKNATLEVEFEDLRDLEEQLKSLDLTRLQSVVAERLRPPRRNDPTRSTGRKAARRRSR